MSGKCMVLLNRTRLDMKYSKEYLNNLIYKDYILLMAEVLNNNGFTDKDRKYEVSTDCKGNFVSIFFSALMLILVGMYGLTNMGNNWNRLCLLNEIGINAAILINILGIEKFGKDNSPDFVENTKSLCRF